MLHLEALNNCWIHMTIFWKISFYGCKTCTCPIVLIIYLSDLYEELMTSNKWIIEIWYYKFNLMWEILYAPFAYISSPCCLSFKDFIKIHYKEKPAHSYYVDSYIYRYLFGEREWGREVFSHGIIWICKRKCSNRILLTIIFFSYFNEIAII